MLDFDKLFFPTPEEELEQKQFLESLEEDARNFWLERGLTDEQYQRLSEIEERECNCLKPYQIWSSRQSLLENGIIELEDILKDIKAST